MITEDFNETIEQRNAFKVANNATIAIKEAFQDVNEFEFKTARLVFEVSETFLFALNASENALQYASEANKLVTEIENLVLASEQAKVEIKETEVEDSVLNS